MKKIFQFLLILACLGSCSGDYRKKAEEPGQLHRSIKKITDIIVHDIFSPPVASRIYTYISVAAYEVARHQDSTLVSLAGQLHGLEPVPEPDANAEYCFPLAAIQATLEAGKAFIFSEDKLEEFHKSVMDEYRRSGMPDDVYERSVEYGSKVAKHIIAWSSKDNYKQTRSFPKYSIDQSPSTWKPTPPAYMDAVEPHWSKIRTFGIDSASQFRCGPPPAFSTDTTSEFYHYAYEVYKTRKNLTDEQRNIASFWDCNPFVMNIKGHVMFATKKISPGGHWMNIVHVACLKSKANFSRSAEAYVRVALALADGFIACWDEKYRSLLIRPESYINQYIDEDWTPLLQTPPFPEYISGHSTISGAASTALTNIFGDNFAFTDSTEVEFGLSVRSFKSFNQAADEAAISRLYGGIHYRPANETGLKMGRSIGAFLNEKIKTRRKKDSEQPV
ncbi:MAG TPA: vanadium-dependent haloperoxidase [Ohtaekwangia sp.]|uniref:vanadium-dependent haloperoxidase n=1 Tax=Ohtaekwangia sp. TaxID=2066019 RepID=UPI002F95B0D0